MRRITIAFAIALSTLLLISICSAQQVSTSAGTKSGVVKSFNGRTGAVLPAANDYSFSLLSGTLASSQFSGTYNNAVTLSNTSNVYYGNGSNLTGVVAGPGSPYYIQNGTTQQASANFNISGSGSANSFDSATTYGIDGNSVLSIGTLTDNNLFLGVGAGTNNVAGSGQLNTFSGYQAGYSNSVGCQNTFSGYQAGWNNTSGGANTFSGYFAGTNITGNNKFYGNLAGYNNYAGNNNVYIASLGCQHHPFCTESSTIRIGGDTGGGPQSATYIAGIYGSTVGGSGIAVYVDSNGQLGTTVSSLRFKEQVRDMRDSTNALMKLRPVSFLYKPEYSNGERTLQYGLIAEEVAKVYPEMVAYDKVGQPYTVRYQYLAPMLLNEMQKQYHRAEAQAKVINAQGQEIESLRQQLQVQNATLQERLARLERVVSNQARTVAQK
jgi:trimeric autotransporter adhesin